MQAQQIVDTFTAIKGDYEDNVLRGVWHAYCDSGIMTDALSVRAAKRIAKAKLTDYADENGLDDINAAVKAYDNGNDLDCVKCINAITALGYDVEDFFEAIA